MDGLRCGKFKDEDKMEKVINLTNVVKQNVKLPTNISIKENDLISMRTNRIFEKETLICSNHRYRYGLFWKPKKICYHPNHKNPISASDLRPCSWNLYSLLKNEGIEFQFGGLICTCCRKNIGSDKVHVNRNNSNGMPPEIIINEVSESSDSETSDEESTDQEAYEEVNSKLVNLKKVHELLSIDKPVFKLSKSVTQISKSRLCSIQKLYEAGVESYTKLFCQSIASEESESQDLKEMIVPNIENTIKTVIESEDSNKKQIITALANLPMVTKAQLIQCGASEYDVRKARQLFNKGPTAKNQTRMKLDIEKADHFTSFLLSSGFLVDSPTKTSIMKISTGENVLISKPVAILKKQQMVNEYKAFCIIEDVQPLSNPTLFKIVDVINPSYQKCLSGLNGTIVFGEDGFKHILNAINSIIPEPIKSQMLEKVTFYQTFMKLEHRKHIQKESDVLNHCATFALSNAGKKEFQNSCQHIHDKWCTVCDGLNVLFENIENALNLYCDSSQLNEEMFEFYRHKGSIINWIKQNIQNTIQEPAKNDAFDTIQFNSNSAVMIRDWAMKVLPQKYRENQSFFFGKKGMSMHLDCLHYYKNDRLCKTTYITCLTSCKQDVFDTLAVFEEVVKQIKRDFPELSELKVRSDNASCYSGNNVIECEVQIGKKYGINVTNHDYNIPQLGKDQADRDAAVAKKSIRLFVDSGQDLLTARDIKNGILFNSAKDVKVAVIEIEDATVENPQTINQISTFHSVSCCNEFMTFYQYYKIGEGKQVKFNKTTKFISNISVESAFSGKLQAPNPEVIKRKRKILSSIDDINPTTSLDVVKKRFIEKIANSTTKRRLSFESKENEAVVQLEEENVPKAGMGWALPYRKTVRFSQKQKDFLDNCFSKGIHDKKQNGEEVLKLMKSYKDQDGKQTFNKDELLTEEQIKGYFSRLASKQKSKLV